MARRIYLASSWRNHRQPAAVRRLRAAGHEVYDFRNPRPDEHGFAWSEVDPEWLAWEPAAFRERLDHPIAVRGFEADFEAMRGADAFVLLLPCGRSAHLEAGWAIGAAVPTCVVLDHEGFEPELMYRLAANIALDVDEACAWLAWLD